MVVFRDEIGKLITEMQSGVSDIEDRLVNVESRMYMISVTANVNSDLAQELESVKGQLNDVVSTNDAEQFNRRDTIRIKGLVPGMDHRRTVIEFLRTQLSLPVQNEDVEAVHVINTTIKKELVLIYMSSMYFWTNVY